MLGRLDPLAEHLEACRKAGATIKRNRSISDLDERVGTAVKKAIGDLPDAARSAALVTPTARRSNGLSGACDSHFGWAACLAGHGPDHDWVQSARRGLCERVFGFGKDGEFHDIATILFAKC